MDTIYWGTDYTGQTIGSTDCDARPSGDQGPMYPGTELSLNSTTDLSSIIVGDPGGYVEAIQFVATGGLRSNEIKVQGCGPSDGGSIDLYFLMSNGYVRNLSVSSSSVEWTTDSFESSGNIVAIWWLQAGPI